MKRYNLYLTEKQIELLETLSRDGLSVSEHIRVAINQYVNKESVESHSKRGGGKRE